MLFVFYQFHPAPIFFNTAELARAQKQATTPKLGQIEAEYDAVRGRTEQQVHALVLARQQGDRAAETSTLRSLRALDTQTQALRAAAKQEIKSLVPRTETKDADYVFIGYITRHFPKGLVGLLIAVILCAAMSATASALNALGSTTVVDFYRRSLRPKASDAHYLAMGKVATAFWGILATLFAAFASLLDNLIQAVNILGSLFYGPTLGVFLVGFFLPRIGGTAIFSALVIAQIAVLGTFFASSISFRWYNVIGCGNVRPDPQPTR
jgi:Na+(H+)/acetate symporter ActP